MSQKKGTRSAVTWRSESPPHLVRHHDGARCNLSRFRHEPVIHATMTLAISIPPAAMSLRLFSLSCLLFMTNLCLTLCLSLFSFFFSSKKARCCAILSFICCCYFRTQGENWNLPKGMKISAWDEKKIVTEMKKIASSRVWVENEFWCKDDACSILLKADGRVVFSQTSRKTRRGGKHHWHSFAFGFFFGASNSKRNSRNWNVMRRLRDDFFVAMMMCCGCYRQTNWT